jgi:predicted transcriptional regulator
LEIESLFSSTRWEILRALSNVSLSPMELASQLNTTSANISQQLRLLELAGLVKSEKTSNVDKGKPRVIYSISENNAYLILAAKNFAQKKLLKINNYHNFILKSWFLDNQDHHRLVSEIYNDVEPELDKIEVVAAKNSGGDLKIFVVGKTFKCNLPKVRVDYVTVGELAKKSDIVVLYDPLGKLNKKGEGKNE